MFEEIRPLQEKLLQILKELKRVCDKNSLTYFLAFGTLLGAVRHKGFIPWDDDVDVCMNYSDYIKLDEACKKDLQSEYFLQSAESDPESHLTFKKLRLSTTTLIHRDFAHKDMNHGISIDIYPVFHVADKPRQRKKQIRAAIMYLLLEVGEPPRHHGKFVAFGSRILLGLIRGRLREKLKKHYHDKMIAYEGVETQKAAMFIGNASNCRELYPAECFKEKIRMTFEDELFDIPEKYDELLTACYGDYMQLPPVEEQGCKLSELVKIDTEKSYKEYKGIYYCVAKKK